MSKKKAQGYVTPTVGASMSPTRLTALGQVALNRSLIPGASKVHVSELVAKAIEDNYGAEIDAVLLNHNHKRCEQCGVIGGCEHTFREEMP